MSSVETDLQLTRDPKKPLLSGGKSIQMNLFLHPLALRVISSSADVAVMLSASVKGSACFHLLTKQADFLNRPEK